MKIRDICQKNTFFIKFCYKKNINANVIHLNPKTSWGRKILKYQKYLFQMDHSLVWQRGLCDSVMLWAMPCRATQDRWVIVKSSDKTWSAGGGNGKPSQYICCENPTNYIKWEKDVTLRDEPPGLEGIQYATAESKGQLPTAPERMEWLGQSRSNTQFQMCLVMKGKPSAVKNGIA